MQNIRVPVWLVSAAIIVFLLVVLERLYITKVPVRIWGIELNQPAMRGPQASNYSLVWHELKAGYKKTEKMVLGEKSAYFYWALAGQTVYRHGQNRAGSLACQIYLENDAWVLEAIGGDQNIEKGAGTAYTVCRAVGLKIENGL